MKQIKFLSMLLALTFALGFTSCSDDDNDDPEVLGYNDYYIEVDVSGGGWNAADLIEFESEMNSELQDYKLYKLEKEEAVEIFDNFVEEMKYDFIDGASDVNETLKMVFSLKTTKGILIKSSTLCVNNKTAWIE